MQLTAWLGLLIHVVVAVVVGRRLTTLPLVPLVNLIVWSGVLLYWAQRWYGYLFRDITWYLSDQWMPALAFVLVVLSILALTGRWPNGTLQWVVLVADTVIFVAAALFVTFFKMKMF